MSAMQPLASLAPSRMSPALTSAQKAAIIVRFLLKEGADVPLERLSEESQSTLTAAIGDMGYIDRETLANVLAEFAREIEAMGLVFPAGLAEALQSLEGRISPVTAARLRKEAGVRQVGDPWDRIRALPAEKLLPLLSQESTEVAAVLLSKLPVPLAAELLGQIPGPEARRISYAVSLTGQVTPGAVDRIGLSLAAQFEHESPRAFEDDPVERLGAILNIANSETRDALLSGLTEEDADFGQRLQKAIFTFVHIPARVGAVDVPKITREVDPEQLRTALAFALATEDEGLRASAEYILGNISKRMAEGMREEIAESGRVKPKEGEAAMNAVVAAIGALQSAGELTLVIAEEDDSEG
ncbi:FliG C-terminal domain-containing protein [uncultured Lentibacter sp.]|uniref:flagellar motor switch protein FliG n=1 Tax=uncultured Lentibacter sp. TaxID=1659309 RepID=UPI00261C95F9|nr:FliG C-terminal domain-containing protein [uncultured Lentibacter sp.]